MINIERAIVSSRADSSCDPASVILWSRAVRSFKAIVFSVFLKLLLTRESTPEQAEKNKKMEIIK